MKRIRKNRKVERTPHPDARVEAELQKILMLRRLAGGYEAQIQHYAAVLDEAQDTIDEAIRNRILSERYFSHISADQMNQAIAASERRITRAETQMSALREEMRRVQEEIGELIAKLSDTDLAFLEPPP